MPFDISHEAFWGSYTERSIADQKALTLKKQHRRTNPHPSKLVIEVPLVHDSFELALGQSCDGFGVLGDSLGCPLVELRKNTRSSSSSGADL